MFSAIKRTKVSNNVTAGMGASVFCHTDDRLWKNASQVNLPSRAIKWGSYFRAFYNLSFSEIDDFQGLIKLKIHFY